MLRQYTVKQVELSFVAGKNEKLVAEMARKVELSEKQKWELKYRQEEMRRNNPTAWFNVQASRSDTALEEKRRQRLGQKILLNHNLGFNQCSLIFFAQFITIPLS